MTGPVTRRGRRRGHEAEDGAAFAFVVLVMLALLVLTHGVMLAALSERSGSRMAVRELRLRGAADHALAAGLAHGTDPALDSMVLWDLRTESLGPVGGVATRATLLRLGPESWLVEGRAGDSMGVEARSARLAWAMDPLTRVLALSGAVTTDTGAAVAIAGSVDVSAPAVPRAPMAAQDCGPWQADLMARYAGAPLAVVAPAEDSTAPLSLGLIDFVQIRDAAPVAVSGSGTPMPAAALGACLDDGPWVWGDPDHPSDPCGGLLPMRASTGDLEMMGGVGQGMLVVDGDLRLTTGARYYGLVIVRGTLALEGGAALEGLALALDGVRVQPGSSLVGSACWAVRALSANRAALRGFVPVSDARIGPM